MIWTKRIVAGGDEFANEHGDELKGLVESAGIELHDVTAVEWLVDEPPTFLISHFLLNAEGRHYLPCEGSGHVHQVECHPAQGKTGVTVVDRALIPDWWKPSADVDVNADQVQDRQDHQDGDQDAEPVGPSSVHDQGVPIPEDEYSGGGDC